MKIETAPARDLSITITASIEEMTLLFAATRRGKRSAKENEALEVFGNALGDVLQLDMLKAPRPDKKRAQRLKNAAQRDIVDAMPVAPVPDVAA